MNSGPSRCMSRSLPTLLLTVVSPTYNPSHARDREILSVWPNSCSRVLSARLAVGQSTMRAELSLLDLAGRPVLEVPSENMLTSGNVRVDLRLPRSVPDGEYILTLKHDSNRKSAPVIVLMWAQSMVAARTFRIRTRSPISFIVTGCRRNST